MRERSRKADTRPFLNGDDEDQREINSRRIQAKGLLNRMFPSMMRSTSFWITAGLIIGVYMVAFLFVKDMVVLPAPAGPDSSPMAFIKRMLTGFAGDYEEKVLETKADGTTVVEQRFTVPTTLVDPSKPGVTKVGGVEITIPSNAPATNAAPVPAAPAPAT
jgi:hypothetical protein